MDISYDNYPLLGFPHSILQDNSGTLPFELISTGSGMQLNSFKRFILCIIEKYSKGNIPTNTYVSAPTLQKINNDTAFSEELFNSFIRNEPTTEIGRILLDNQKICMYLSLNNADTSKQFHSDGSYFGVAYFSGESLKGFEEVFITEQGFEKGDSLYVNHSDEGKFISFSMKCLALSRNSKQLLNLSKIQEAIYLI